MPEDIGLQGADMALRAADTAVRAGQLLLDALAKSGRGALAAAALAAKAAGPIKAIFAGEGRRKAVSRVSAGDHDLAVERVSSKKTLGLKRHLSRQGLSFAIVRDPASRQKRVVYRASEAALMGAAIKSYTAKLAAPKKLSAKERIATAKARAAISKAPSKGAKSKGFER